MISRAGRKNCWRGRSATRSAARWSKSAIDDEVLLREAYRRGLDRDAVVRQHLVQKMRYILGEDEATPTEAELRAYLAANRERYRSPPRSPSTRSSTPTRRRCRMT